MTEAVGCFSTYFYPEKDKNDDLYLWHVKPSFTLPQQENHILALFKKHLKCGLVYTNRVNNYSVFTVRYLEPLQNHIIPFFERFKFQSTKRKKDFSSFCKILQILETDNLTKTYFEKIILLRGKPLPLGVDRIYSDEKILYSIDKKTQIDDINNFLNTEPSNLDPTKSISNEIIKCDLYGDIKANNALNFTTTASVMVNPLFNVSFCKTDDDSNLAAESVSNPPRFIGWQIIPSFTQAEKGPLLVKFFQKELNCGKAKKGSQKGYYYFEVLDLNDLRTKMIPYFDGHIFYDQLESYQKFCKTVDILSHLPFSRADLEEILSYYLLSYYLLSYYQSEGKKRID